MATHLRSRHLVLACFLATASACAPMPPPASCPPAPSAPTNSDLAALTDEQLARRLLELLGAANLGKQVLDSMADTMKKLPGIPPDFMQRFKENAHPEELTALVVPIYVRHYKRETLLAAIHFYESREGQSMTAELPVVTQESMAAGRDWGRALAQKTMAEMQVTPQKPSP